MTLSSESTLPVILVLSPIRPAQMHYLESNYEVHRYELASRPNDDHVALVDAIGERVTVVITSGSEGVPAALVHKLPNLKLVALSSVGYENVDVPAFNALGITVTNTPDVLTDDVADTAIALLLAQRRNLVVGDAWVRNGLWANKGAMPLTQSIRGKRLGIVGLGRIGKAIAARAEPMGLEISYFGRNAQANVPYFFEPNISKLAEWADILVLACPGGAATHHLVNADVLYALGEKGSLINVARGSVVDEGALIEALKNKTIAGAGLDVFATEPDDGKRFAEFDNVVLYPHHSSGTVETRDAMAQLVVDNVEAFFNERPLLSPIH
jgi:lactate dehydrogenase-like 2-hydroxyacid dehydrogenase